MNNRSSTASRSKARGPFCLRFKAKDLENIRLAAAKQGEIVTTYIREAAMSRVVAMEAGVRVPKLRFELFGHDDPVGEQVSVRFPPDIFQRIVRQAAEEGQLPSSWIRSVAIEFANRIARKTAVGE